MERVLRSNSTALAVYHVHSNVPSVGSKLILLSREDHRAGNIPSLDESCLSSSMRLKTLARRPNALLADDPRPTLAPC